MSRVVLMLLMMSGAAMAHPGHGESGFHLHAGPAIFLLAAVLAVALWRFIHSLSQIVRQRRQTGAGTGVLPAR